MRKTLADFREEAINAQRVKAKPFAERFRAAIRATEADRFVVVDLEVAELAALQQVDDFLR